jgi:nucleotide-binding universal stress UspA family protein
VTTALFIVFAIWVVTGLLTGVAMGRRGHSWFGWTVIGCVLGPLVIPVALSSVGRPHDAPAIRLARGDVGSGRLRVIVGIDGSAESLVAMQSAIDLLGDEIGGFTLAAVVDIDAARPDGTGADQRHAQTALAEAAQVADEKLGRAAETILLTGAPAAVLVGHATATGANLLAIGSRGRGASRRLLGSVATQLAANAPVPVLVVGRQDRPEAGPSA